MTDTPSSVTKTTLSNGLTILLDRSPQFHAVGVALALLGGSRDEQQEVNGVTHLLEHLLFKRTDRLNTREIAEQIDEWGGEMNAFTDADSLTIYGVFPKGSLLDVVRFMADLIRSSAYTEQDLSVEREIVRQELLDAADSVEEVTYQEFRRRFWSNSTLAFPVAGTLESLERLDLKIVQQRHRDLMCGNRLLLTISGDFDPQALTREIERIFNDLPLGTRSTFPAPSTNKGSVILRKPAHHIYLIAARPGPEFANPDYIPVMVLVSLLGQGNSSYLFQRLREECGICYNIEAALESYRDTGAVMISGSFERKDLARTLSLIDEQLKRAISPTSESDYRRHIRMMLSQLELEEDNVRSRLWRAVETELALGRYVPIDEVKTRLAELTIAELLLVAERYLFGSEPFTVLGGNVRKADLKEFGS